MDLMPPPRRTPLPPDTKMEFLEERYMMDEDVLHQQERKEWSAEMAVADLYTSRGAGGGGGGGGGGRCQAWVQRLALFNGSAACLEECWLDLAQRRSSASV